MTVREFYNEEIKENPSISSTDLMDKYAKYIVTISFCDGSPRDFDEMSIVQLKKINKVINNLIDWTNE